MSPLDSDRRESGPPLWSIGIAMALMLIVPMVLYSIAPPGPIREGDTIFSDGAVKVPFVNPLLYESAKFDGTCLLDPHDPLMVIRRPSEGPDSLIFAKVQGKTAIEWPFCPPQAEVILTQRQIMQKVDVLSETKEKLTEWWKR
jgi:hypothetical protein